jgi:hypothetical protein
MKSILLESIVDTPAFRRWFGNSKVVDKNNKPIIAYHGTTKNFNEFMLKYIGTSTDEGYLGAGFYFSRFPQNAMAYSGYYDFNNFPDKAKGGNIMPVYLKIENPVIDKEFDIVEKLFGTVHGASKKMMKYFKSKGYDGIIARGEYVVFEPIQIKSAIGNKGTFDSNDPDITKENL